MFPPEQGDIIFDLKKINEEIVDAYSHEKQEHCRHTNIGIRLETLRLTIYKIPFEDGSNIGEIEFVYCDEGSKAIWGLYADGHVAAFMD